MQTMANMTWSALFRRGQGNAHSSRQQELEAKSIRRALRIKLDDVFHAFAGRGSSGDSVFDLPGN